MPQTNRHGACGGRGLTSQFLSLPSLEARQPFRATIELKQTPFPALGGYIPAGLMPVAMGFIIDAVGLSLGATLFAAVLASIAALGGLWFSANSPGINTPSCSARPSVVANPTVVAIGNCLAAIRGGASWQSALQSEARHCDHNAIRCARTFCRGSGSSGEVSSERLRRWKEISVSGGLGDGCFF